MTFALRFSSLTLSFGASDLRQDPEGPGLGGPAPWAPVLRVLHDALPAGVSVGGHVVEVDVCLHHVFPGSPGTTRHLC